jgi:hypothetical protein
MRIHRQPNVKALLMTATASAWQAKGSVLADQDTNKSREGKHMLRLESFLARPSGQTSWSGGQRRVLLRHRLWPAGGNSLRLVPRRLGGRELLCTGRRGARTGS